MGRAITHARVNADVATQAEFSRAIDVRYQYMSRVEARKENLTLKTLAKMTGLLGIAIPDFLARVAQEMRNPATRRAGSEAGPRGIDRLDVAPGWPDASPRASVSLGGTTPKERGVLRLRPRARGRVLGLHARSWWPAEVGCCAPGSPNAAQAHRQRWTSIQLAANR